MDKHVAHLYCPPLAAPAAGCGKRDRRRQPGAGLGLTITSLISHWLLGQVNLWFVAPMDASAVLLFGLPNSPLAQPWSIVGGNLVAGLIGVIRRP
nr:putative urate catabolism protein [Candidatus Pantoea persica]